MIKPTIQDIAAEVASLREHHLLREFEASQLRVELSSMRQHVSSLRAEKDRLHDQLFSTMNQLDVLVLAIKQADFRMRGFNPLMDAVDLLYRDLFMQNESASVVLHSCNDLFLRVHYNALCIYGGDVNASCA